MLNLAGLKSSDAFIDWGSMSGWGLGYKVYEKEWSNEQLSILGIDKSYMPKIAKPWDIIGTLSAEAGLEISCPMEIPICAGASDTMQSMLGSGIFEANKAVDVAGTCAMFCVSTIGIIPELSRKGSGLIFNSGTLENAYFYWGFVRTGGLALRWFKDHICQQGDDDSYYETLSQGAAKVAPGCTDVIFLPYLTGGYDECSNVKGCFLNMTLGTDNLSYGGPCSRPLPMTTGKSPIPTVSPGLRSTASPLLKAAAAMQFGIRSKPMSWTARRSP